MHTFLVVKKAHHRGDQTQVRDGECRETEVRSEHGPKGRFARGGVHGARYSGVLVSNKRMAERHNL